MKAAILNPNFKYTSAAGTDIRYTLARAYIRQGMPVPDWLRHFVRAA